MTDYNSSPEITPERSGKRTSGTNAPHWVASVKPFSTRKLDSDIEADVVVIGGGIAGVSTAYSLCRSGFKVVLIEDGNIGSGETGRTSAHLVSALDNRFYQLEELYGEESAKIIAESHSRAIDFVEANVDREKIDCDFKRVPGYLLLHPSDRSDALKLEFDAAKKAGLEVETLDAIPGVNQSGKCLRFANQAVFHPLKYIYGLCEAILKYGGEIYTETHAEEINSAGIVSSDGHRVDAKYIVVATNTPVNNKLMMHLRQYPYRTFMIGMKIRKGALPNALWWDTGDPEMNADFQPYHYVRIQPFNDEYDLLTCGGEDHQIGSINDDHGPDFVRYANLEQWTRARFPVEDVVYHWSGQVMETMDALGYIGRNPLDRSNVFIITGDSGNGLTNAGVAAILIPALVEGKDHPWKELYAPSRFKLFTAGKVFVKEVIGAMTDYIKSFPRDTGREVLAAMHAGDGRIIEMKGRKYGVYKDNDNQFHFVSAECNHLHCIVKWNSDERTWDCPCHGSRYTYQGKVINGPANENLHYHVIRNIEAARAAVNQ